ncbi:hypothetical protein CC1G_01720 [Coprinopsis cinerea okayama7|uniref:UreD-domain-containing protein n=1 Tax=Coprinopsis cinerea (strain Okayama-7 / 130 / ATCC MYA-4618 / FGSC 9003) TaxID=240176 RepID=A8N2K3_COPC7|nr:hypothetical protein CC1G_01720 [Coprinopsis cinerea okayama7\|eukprot:XP_001829040.1 hypothetical protein CC1G_01720 [Coprinopsis cinerea okayama7\
MASSSSLPPGHGRVVVSSHAAKAVFAELASTYPLKLLSPRVAGDGVAVVYVMGYGGGLVGGDEVFLTVEVQRQASLVLLTQGSTKVFKTRIGARLASGTRPHTFQDRTLTVQTMSYRVGSGSSLFLLPEPVTCFRNASYNQIQTFDLEETASLVLLDSITEGRQAQGEDWDLSRYYSMNRVKIGKNLVANDVLLLEDQGHGPQTPGLPSRSLRDQLAPYSCYAMAILCGPQVQDTIKDIAEQYEPLAVYQRRTAEDCIWSFSPLDAATTFQAAIVRVAGKEAQLVRSRLKIILRQLEGVVGVDVYRRAFA